MPYIPALVRIPDRRAEAGAGATGCAFGSQICSGKAPAFAPKPKSRHKPAVQICVEELLLLKRTPDRSRKYKVPVTSYRRKIPINMTSPPITATAR